MSERLGLFKGPEHKYTKFNLEEWKRQIEEQTLTHPQPPLPAAEPPPIPAPRKAHEAQPSAAAHFLAPLKAARQKEKAR